MYTKRGRLVYLFVELQNRDVFAYCTDYYTDEYLNTLHLIYNSQKKRHWESGAYYRYADEVTVIRPSKNCYKVLHGGTWNKKPLASVDQTADYIATVLRKASAKRLG